MSIRTKLILAIISVLLVTGIGMGGVIYWQNDQKLTEHSYADVKNTVDYASQLVNFYLGRAESSLSGLVDDPLMADVLTTKDPEKIAQVSEQMTALNKATDILENVGLFEVNGSSCINLASNKTALSTVGRDFSDRDYCKGILKTQKQYLSSAYISSVSKNPILAMVIPIKNIKNEMIGFVFGAIGLAELRGYLWDLQKDSSIMLLDRYGVPFIDTAKTITKLDEPPIPLVSDIEKRISEGNKEGYFHNQDVFVGYTFDESIVLVYQKSVASLLSLTRRLNFTVILSLIVMVLVTTIIIYLFLSTITKRISRLSLISQKIAGGQFEIMLDKDDLTAKDETTVLARAFNDMATKLSDMYRTMDEKVKERTTELERSKDELERMNSFMVDRELKFAEMKKETHETQK